MKTLFLILLLTLSGWAQPIGKVVPDFTFQTLEGESVTLGELRESSPTGVVLLTFWCTTCNSCRASEEPLKKLSDKYKDKARVYAVSSSRQDSPASVSRYLDKHKLKLPVLLDSHSELARHFNIKRTTTTLLMDSEGRLRYHGALLRKRRFYAEGHLQSVLAGKIVGQPIGPIYG